jgi:CpXC protein
MSVFRTREVTCPSCRREVSFEVVYSVNADRRSDLRDQILNGIFQESPCPRCGVPFRLSPEFTYLDQSRQLWVAAYGAGDLARWEEAEQEAQETYDEAFGSGASEAARGIGDVLTRRVAFGWPAIREKVLLRERDLDDVTIELLKAAILKSGGASISLNGDVELRVVAVRNDALGCAWIRTSSEEIFEVIEVPWEAYEGIVADPEPWKELRGELERGQYVDMNRLLSAK